MRLLKDNLFSLALFAAVLLAFLMPQLGAADGPLRAATTTKIGIMVIFLVQGLSLKMRELCAGITDFRLHGFIQAWIFLGSPLCFLPGYLILRTLGNPELAEGVLYLAILPTTISSAVALTSAAGGNVAASIVSTALSNLIGVFWVPTLAVLLFAGGGSHALDLVPPLLLNLAQLILLPMGVGMLLRPFLSQSSLFKHIQPRFKLINNGIIIFIVFSAFCQSFLGNAWAGLSAAAMVLLIAVMLLCMVALHWFVWKSAPLAGITGTNRISALFCGSQKTLAAGVPMAMAIFASGNLAGTVPLSLLLLPLMCYHPAQLFLAAILIPRLGKMN